MIGVTVNGGRREMEPLTTLVEFLKARGLDGQFVAVAYNGDVLDKADYPRIVLREGDVLEIVRPVGGG